LKRFVFITGARSEYGIARPLLSALNADPEIELGVIVHGMHLSREYGYTVSEIRKDDFTILCEVDTLSGSIDKPAELSRTILEISSSIRAHNPDAVLIIGDRLEAVGSALAASLNGVPIVHSGGGHLTSGSLDDRYRYMVSTLASLHLTTSRNATMRVKALPIVNPKDVHFVGSVAIDAIKKFLQNPYHISDVIPELASQCYALATFHPATFADEDIPGLLIKTVETVLSLGKSILITAPNNDIGCEDIKMAIESVLSLEGVYYRESLGVPSYYAAMYSCDVVIGNSSSALMEAPYFEKPVIDVGSRQNGRDKDLSVKTISANKGVLEQAIKEFHKNTRYKPKCNELYGNGNSVIGAFNAIKQFLKKI